MSSRREKLLQRIDPKYLEKTPKLSLCSDSFVHLDLGGETLEEGAKELMLRFFKKHETIFKNKSVEDGVTLSDSKYQESFRLCQSISKRLSLSFACESTLKLERPGKKLQDLKKQLEEKMSAKRKEEYHKRVDEYKRWQKEINDKNKALDSNDESADEFSDDEIGNGNDDDGGDGDEDRNDMDGSSNKENQDIDNPNKVIESQIEKNGGDHLTDKQREDENILEVNCDNDLLKVNLNQKVSDTESVLTEANQIVAINSFNSTENTCNINQKPSEIFYENQDLDEDNENEEENNFDKCSFLPPYQPRNKLTCSSVEQSQCSQGLPSNLLSPSLKLALMNGSQSPKAASESPLKDNLTTASNSSSYVTKNKLFSNLPSQLFDIDDALEYCSGKFPDDTQELLQNEEDTECKNSNQNNFSLEEDDADSDDEIEEKRETLQKDSPQSKKRIIAFDASEDETSIDIGEKNEESGGRIISDDEDEFCSIKKPEPRRFRPNLHFSDEEEDSNDGEPFNKISDKDDSDSNIDDNENDNDNDSEIDDENDDQRSVYYDSEENEIRNPKDFFDREAELSGSEFSGDEDEKGLDEFDEEAGDADSIDLDQVHSQLGKIHLRRLLDDDSRNVRFLQELFFEDGDLHTDDEFKKFRWRNLAKLEEEQPMVSEGGNANIVGDSSDEEGAEDVETRRERLKRQLLQESLQENGELSFECGLFKNVLRKLKVTTVKNELEEKGVGNRESGENLGNLTGLPTMNPDSISQNKTRGSFLKRNEEILSRLAKVISTADNVRGPKNSKNFVFSTKSPEKGNSEIKRQLEEVEVVREKKKPKLLPHSTIPSILDLLE